MDINEADKPVPNDTEKTTTENSLKTYRHKTPASNKNLFLVYIRLVLGIVGIFAVFLFAGLFVYSKITNSKAPTPAPSFIVDEPNPLATPTPSGNILSDILEAPDKTNFLLVGTDASELLTDVIIAGCFDKNLTNFSLISIPRDTYTKISSEDVAILQNAGRYVPSNGVMKLNEVHSYAGKESGVLFTKKQVEAILGVSIDYYAEVNLNAFRNIVDAVGGIYMEIPSGGFYYVDDTPGQNLTIAVPGGMQLLDGAMAEGVVRYRNTYPRGDLQRIEMQQEFMKQFFSQVLNKETIIKNALTFITTVVSYVNTNFPITDAPKYIKYLDKLNSESIITYTLPGTDTRINEISYFIVDEEKTKELANEIFYKNNAAETPAPQETATTELNLKKLKIQILNGTDKEGLASEKSEMLKQYGYNIINVGNYYGEQQEKTRIIVKKSGNYAELAKLFKETVISTDPELNENYDILIILGLSE